MCSNEVFINWDNHHATLISIFEKLLNSSTLVDCTITAEGKIIKAHRIVLSACSSFFQMLFSQESERNPIVVFTDIKFRELKSIIDYMYHGKVKIPADELDLFMETAATLQIRGLGINHLRNEVGKRSNESDSKSLDQTSGFPNTVKRRRKTSSNCSKENSMNSVKIDDSRNDSSRINQKTSSHEAVNLTQNQFQSSPPIISSDSSFFRPASSVVDPLAATENERNKSNHPSYSAPQSPFENLPQETQIIEDIELQPITQIFLPEIVGFENADSGGTTEDSSDVNSKEKYPTTEDHNDTLKENNYTQESRESVAQDVSETPVQPQARLKESFQQLVMSQIQKLKKNHKQQPSLVQDPDIYPPIQIHSTYTCEEFNQLPNDGSQSEERIPMSTLSIDPAPVQEINKMCPAAYSESDPPVGQSIRAPQGGLNDSEDTEMHSLVLISDSSHLAISPLPAQSTNCVTGHSTPNSSMSVQASTASIGPCISRTYPNRVGITSNFKLCENPSMHNIGNLNGMTFRDVSPQTEEGTNYVDIPLTSERGTTFLNILPRSPQANEPWRFSQRPNRHGCFKCGQVFRSPYLLEIHKLKHKETAVIANENNY